MQADPAASRMLSQSLLALSIRSLRPGYRTVRGLASNLCSTEHVFGHFTRGSTSTSSNAFKTQNERTSPTRFIVAL